MSVQRAAIKVDAQARGRTVARDLLRFLKGHLQGALGVLLDLCCLCQLLLRLRTLGAHGDEGTAHRIECGALAAQA